MRISEHDSQKAVIDWFNIACRTYKLPPYALMAIPNAGKRSYAAAAWMRAEGLRTGVPDLFLAVPKKVDNYWMGGCWVEMKKGRNKPSDEQRRVMDYLRGWYVVQVCYSTDEAINVIKEYLCA